MPFYAAMAAYLLACLLHLSFCLLGKEAARRATKAVLMPLLLMAACLAGGAPPALVLGLCCGFLGDVLLLSPQRKGCFMGGLAAFLAGHLSYCIAIGGGLAALPGWPARVLAACVLLGVGAAAYGGLRRGLGGMRGPVTAYLLAILAMAYLAALGAIGAPNPASLLVLAGAGLFILSDYLLAFSLFKRPFGQMDFCIMSTYLGAQLFITAGLLLR